MAHVETVEELPALGQCDVTTSITCKLDSFLIVGCPSVEHPETIVNRTKDPLVATFWELFSLVLEESIIVL